MAAQYSNDYLAQLEREERERVEEAAENRWVNLGFRIRNLRAGLARIWASDDPDVWSLAPAFCRDIARLTNKRARLLG